MTTFYPADIDDKTYGYQYSKITKGHYRILLSDTPIGTVCRRRKDWYAWAGFQTERWHADYCTGHTRRAASEGLIKIWAQTPAHLRTQLMR